jgi:hypothetical protein
VEREVFAAADVRPVDAVRRVVEAAARLVAAGFAAAGFVTAGLVAADLVGAGLLGMALVAAGFVVAAFVPGLVAADLEVGLAAVRLVGDRPSVDGVGSRSPTTSAS